MTDQPLILLTPGDINGIGPEVTLKALEKITLKVPLIILSSASVYRFYSDRCDIPHLIGKQIKSIDEAIKPGVYFLNIHPQDDDVVPSPGEQTVEAGKLSMQAIEYATELCTAHPNIAMVTAPISKEAVNKAGYSITGHTDYLAEKDHTTDYIMMLSSTVLRVVPLTAHIPLAEVASHVTEENILKTLTALNATLKRDFGLDVPRIAVLGLNPHAGDGGVIGKEELEILRPALEKAYKQKIHAEGPFAADGFFASKLYANYDAVLSMYHDQGLIPFKTLTFNTGINFTAGLSFIRTSPDHGTAYGIAGLNKADYGYMREAIEMAQYLVRRRKKLFSPELILTSESTQKTMPQKNDDIYNSLALIYDEVMRDVDYEDWADFIDAIIQEHNPDAESIFELACGTGKIAMFLDELECYTITATDFSEAMLEQGKRIADFRKLNIKWQQQDFYDIQIAETFDIVLMLFDSINYILTDEKLELMLANVRKVMHDDSLFIFDFTTQKHSQFVEELLNDEGITHDDYRFERKSYYLKAERLHINEFDIEKLDKDKLTVLERYREVHRQKIYELKEMATAVKKAGFDMVAAYEDFDFIDATENSERITMVLSCRKNP